MPHSARIWNYWLGGKDNYTVDREMGDQVAEIYPGIFDLARADRNFLQRAVRYLVAEAGIRQFLDVGTGLPTANNTHEVAQAIAPETKIVYADNDPLVLVHAQALLTSSPEGKCDYIDADIHDPQHLLDQAAATLDLTRPVAVMLLGILNFVLGDEEGYAVVSQLMDAMPSGSYLAITHPTGEIDTEEYPRTVELWNQYGEPKMRLRTKAEIERFFDGLEILDPGVVTFLRWRPEASRWTVRDVPGYCALAHKPGLSSVS